MSHRRSLCKAIVAYVSAERRTRSDVAREFWGDKAANGTVLGLLCELGLVDDDSYESRNGLRARVAELQAKIDALKGES